MGVEGTQRVVKNVPEGAESRKRVPSALSEGGERDEQRRHALHACMRACMRGVDARRGEERREKHAGRGASFSSGRAQVGVGVDGAGDGDALLLPAREGDPLLPNLRVVPCKEKRGGAT